MILTKEEIKVKKHRALKIVLRCIGLILALVIVFVGGFIIFAGATTLKVKDSEAVEISGNGKTDLSVNEPINILTWNIGYGALDERQDCYWDGGKGVDGESKEVVQENIDAIRNTVKELDPDIFLIQEADTSSKRSYRIDELASFKETFKGFRFANLCF